MLWYIGDNDDEKGLRYGDPVKVKPLKENLVNLGYFYYEIKNLRTGKTISEARKIKNILNEYTDESTDVIQTEVDKKPILTLDGYICPRCKEKVSIDKDSYMCLNCLQNLDWNLEE